MDRISSIYDDLHKKFEESVINNRLDYDPVLLNKQDDTRFGVTLAIRFPDTITSTICNALKELRAVCPEQYFYRPEEFHITALTLITCHDGFTRDMFCIDTFQTLIRNAVTDINPFTITLKGLTASPAGILIKGFQDNGTLNTMRDRLRSVFNSSKVNHSIDGRYPLVIAHSTVMRFQTPIQNPDDLLRFLQLNSDTHYGDFTVNSLSLIYNDWYLSHDKIEHIADFSLS